MQLNEAQREAYLLSYDQDPPEECAWIHISLFKDVVLPLLPQVEDGLAERLFREDRLAKSVLARPIAKRIREICEERRRLVLMARELYDWWPGVREWNRTQRPLWDLRRLLADLPS